ncbi:pilus assembly FimT family protein [Azohydromonas lata]|uniref:Prepilin-type N-terminal cleavage/methylation domain-containing protein n=1 Tax=Azohydromonas lata TaxID=45677 RepID=A0ABU5ILI7_9BURK|nr:prepilin-type N-terminal cleavage/methylation domain-containing protein [Azohydromonas lata]MDZ5459744.1 prepilin-type N-terminal cleavage/methylation domain-containing protein [Azohydromonas lata]
MTFPGTFPAPPAAGRSTASSHPSRAPWRRRPAPHAGYTLVELLVVISLVALGTMLVEPALPDARRDALEREAMRLAAMLEGARAQSRLQGRLVRWQPRPGGFGFTGTAQGRTVAWLTPQVQVAAPGELVLGPEPMLQAQALTLVLGPYRVRIASDGLAPFAVAR